MGQIIVVLALSVIISIIRIMRLKEKKNKLRIIEILFINFTVICFGGLGIWGFIGHVFVADILATNIGWPTGNPFQTEIGITNLAVGITAILAIFIRENYWIASTVVNSIFLLGAATLHLQEMIEKNNYNIGNTFILISDIGVSVIVIILLVYWLKERKSDLLNAEKVY